MDIINTLLIELSFIRHPRSIKMIADTETGERMFNHFCETNHQEFYIVMNEIKADLTFIRCMQMSIHNKYSTRQLLFKQTVPVKTGFTLHHITGI